MERVASGLSRWRSPGKSPPHADGSAAIRRLITSPTSTLTGSAPTPARPVGVGSGAIPAPTLASALSAAAVRADATVIRGATGAPISGCCTCRRVSIASTTRPTFSFSATGTTGGSGGGCTAAASPGITTVSPIATVAGHPAEVTTGSTGSAWGPAISTTSATRGSRSTVTISVAGARRSGGAAIRRFTGSASRVAGTPVA